MSNSEGCLDCGRGLCELCNTCSCCDRKSPGNIKVGEEDSSTTFVGRKSRSSDESSRRDKSVHKNVGRPIKEPNEIKDRQSTGRKRAALLYPITPDSPCEWQRLSNCGGGKHPIIGCANGRQQHRHHGPNKDTLQNGPGNVHRICDNCHNIWHSQNDEDYDPSIKHNPRKATLEELADRISKVRYCVED